VLALSQVPASIIDGLRKQGFNVVQVVWKRFPDGEFYLRIPKDEISASEIFIVTTMYPEQSERFVELYLALDALRGIGVKAKSIAILYLAYARQDKRFLPGEPISIAALLRPLTLYAVNELVVVDIHAYETIASEVKELNIRNILPHSYLAKSVGIKVDFVLAPDKGALHRAKSVAEEYNVGYDYLEKFRDRISGEIRISEKELDVRGKHVVVVDDIVSTGGTLAKAIEALYKAGASKVYAIVTHALLVGNAIKKLEDVGIDMLITANTIIHSEVPSWLRVVDISPLVAEALRRS